MIVFRKKLWFLPKQYLLYKLLQLYFYPVDMLAKRFRK